MIYVVAAVTVKAGKLSEYLEIFKSNVPTVLKEKGCIEYVPTVDAQSGIPPQELNENIVTILEKWESVEDLQTHIKAPHMLEYRGKTKDLVEKVSLKVLGEA